MSPRSSPEQTVFSRAHAILLGFSNLKTSFSLVASTKDDANKEMCYEQARLKLKIFEYCGIKRKGPLTLTFSTLDLVSRVGKPANVVRKLYKPFRKRDLDQSRE